MTTHQEHTAPHHGDAAKNLRLPEFPDILKPTFEFYKEHFAHLALVLIGVIVAVLPLILVLIGYAAFTAFMYAADTGAGAAAMVRLIFSLLGILSILFIFFWGGLSTIALIRASFDGKKMTVIERYKDAFDFMLILKLIGGLIASAIMLLIGFVLLVIPGIYIAVPLTIWPYVLVKEKCGLVESFLKAFSLIQGYWFAAAIRIGWFVLLSSVVSWFIALVLGYVFGFMGLIGFFVVAFISWIINTFIIGLLSYIYYRMIYEHLAKVKEKHPDAKHVLTQGEWLQFIAVVVLGLVWIITQLSMGPYGANRMFGPEMIGDLRRFQIK